MIENLKDLQALLKLCRKQGVTSIKIGSAEIHFGDLPKRASGTSDEESTDETATDELTPEQLMFYSAGGPHEDQEGR